MVGWYVLTTTVVGGMLGAPDTDVGAPSIPTNYSCSQDVPTNHGDNYPRGYTMKWSTCRHLISYTKRQPGHAKHSSTRQASPSADNRTRQAIRNPLNKARSPAGRYACYLLSSHTWLAREEQECCSRAVGRAWPWRPVPFRRLSPTRSADRRGGARARGFPVVGPSQVSTRDARAKGSMYGVRWMGIAPGGAGGAGGAGLGGGMCVLCFCQGKGESRLSGRCCLREFPSR